MRKSCLLIVLVASFFQLRAQQFTFVFLHKNPDAEKLSEEVSKKIMEGHMGNINRLAKEGKLISAGPFEGGGGIFILNTLSVDDAREWLSADPGIQAKRWHIEFLPYVPTVGSACAVGENYTMVSYSFIRFMRNNHVTTKNTEKLLLEHDGYVKTLTVPDSLVTVGTFGKNQGGILVTRGDLSTDTLEKDPAIRQGLLAYEIKKLWIAKGAFCEK